MPLRESIKVFRKLLPYITRNWKWLLLALLLMLISNQLATLIPLLMKRVIDEAIANKEFNLLIILSIAILLLTIGTGVLSGSGRYLGAIFAQRVVYEIRLRAFRSILSKSFAFFDKMPTGQIVARVSSDVDRVAEFLTRPLMGFTNALLLSVLAVIAMLSINLELTVVTLLVLLPIALNFYFYGKRVGPLYLSLRQQYGVLASVINNNLMGIRTVKYLAVEEHEVEKFRKENNKWLNLALKLFKVQALHRPMSTLIIGLGVVIIITIGFLNIVEGRLTVGGLWAFISYMFMLLWPMRIAGFFITAFQRAMSACHRVFTVIEAKEDVEEEGGLIELKNVKGEIVFENVWFSYDGKHYVLKDINLRIRPGEKVAIVGPTGSGKSTLIRLIPRFYEVNKGRILIDGCDIRKIKLESLRRNIAIVPQEPFIFATTVKENIAVSKPDASMDEIVKAAKLARIHDFIESLPKGYNTLVGEYGVTLSGGQKQRIEIARAFLVDPPILILDDPTSNLDAETEREIVKDLRELMKGRTTIIVSQRLPLVLEADRIIVLDEGRIVEEGTHEELVRRKGAYWKLFKDQIEAYESWVKELLIVEEGENA
ncbi:MAG: ABC transporter ATP-binding protein [Thermoprotei archaeon]|nr:MAG: ABC transporter ATP-binding protein [Thermoprotei archaeon]